MKNYIDTNTELGAKWTTEISKRLHKFLIVVYRETNGKCMKKKKSRLCN